MPDTPVNICSPALVILLSTEGYQIIYYFSLMNRMLFYYIQDVYQKNQLGTRLKDRHNPRIKHNHQKSKCSEYEQHWGIWGTLSPSAGLLGVGTP